MRLLNIDLDSTLFIPWDDSFREIQEYLVDYPNASLGQSITRYSKLQPDKKRYSNKFPYLARELNMSLTLYNLIHAVDMAVSMSRPCDGLATCPR